ncbi:hypothetical protein [Ferrovum sp.]|uniref:hypothetical protein n=1 Tax=Ferrovum sp. TaxID=2609467 RepID=UPI002616455F|nr:hypothetical protein [Ferrovum sp.]
MARSRNIKPGFYLNDQLAECSLLARFIFPGLWMLADRAGRLEDRPLRIKAAILPYDNADINKLLSELHGTGMIVRYEIDKNKYIQVVNFEKHQNPHVREPESTIPAPFQHHSSTGLAPVQHQSSTSPARLIPDSLLLIPDSPLLNPDSLIPGKVKNKHARVREGGAAEPEDPAFAPPDGGCVVNSEPMTPVLEKAVERETCPVEPEPADTGTNAPTGKAASKVHKAAKTGIHHQDAIDTLRSHDVPQAVIDDYLTLRTNRKAALTPTAVKIFLTEVNKSGWTPEQAMSECCVRGWTGFKADWVSSLTNPASTNPAGLGRPLNRQESLEARNRAIGERVCAEMMRELQQSEASNPNQPGDFLP